MQKVSLANITQRWANAKGYDYERGVNTISITRTNGTITIVALNPQIQLEYNQDEIYDINENLRTLSSTIARGTYHGMPIMLQKTDVRNNSQDANRNEHPMVKHKYTMKLLSEESIGAVHNIT